MERFAPPVSLLRENDCFGQHFATGDYRMRGAPFFN
jgi:hypothetical protein